MQTLPFVFSLIFVFFLLISRLGQEDKSDRMLFKAFNKKAELRLNLLKKAERACLYEKKISLKKTKEPTQEGNPQIPQKPSRALKPAGNFAKLSLGFLQKPLDEMTIQFVKKELFRVLQKFYKEDLSYELYEEFLKASYLQKPLKLCQLRLKNRLLQQSFYKLLIHPDFPLEELVTLEMFDNKALFYFSHLQKGLFDELFSQTVEPFYCEEQKLQKMLKTKNLPKESLTFLLPNLAPTWSLVSIDQLICFKNPDKKALKANFIKDAQEFFHFIVDLEGG